MHVRRRRAVSRRGPGEQMRLAIGLDSVKIDRYRHGDGKTVRSGGARARCSRETPSSSRERAPAQYSGFRARPHSAPQRRGLVLADHLSPGSRGSGGVGPGARSGSQGAPARRRRAHDQVGDTAIARWPAAAPVPRHEGDVGSQALADDVVGDDARRRSRSQLPGRLAAVVTAHHRWTSVAETRIAAQLPHGGTLSRTPSPN